MKSEGNPNFGGTYHGECSSLWSEEKRKKSIDKMIATFKREGTVAGKKNPKWNGGTKTYPCIVCGTETSPYPPGIWKAIENGERVPACSKRCSLIHGRKNLLEEMTSIEILMMNKLIEHNVEFIPQYSLDDIYFVDFYLPNYNIVIECDGDYWHGNPIRFPNPTKQQLYQINHDKIKNGYIFKKKMKLFRFWECDLNTRLDECFQQVLDKINEVDSPRKKVIK
jgi:very-short-patch-repair endonuclease